MRIANPAVDDAGAPRRLVGGCRQSLPVLLSRGEGDPVVPPLQSKFSLRVIGGGPLRPGVLCRSGAICGVDVGEEHVLRALGIRTIYDLRKGWEVALYPEPTIHGIRHVAVMPPEVNTGERRRNRLSPGVIGRFGPPGAEMLRAYRKLAHDGPLLGRILRGIAAEGVPALIHCTNGKDRVGVLSATILRMLGATEHEIMLDYLQTNVCNAERNARDFLERGEGMTPEEQEILLSFFEARPEYLNAYFEAVDDLYGSFDTYVETCLAIDEYTRERIGVLCPATSQRSADPAHCEAVSC